MSERQKFEKLPKIKELYADCIDVQGINVNWGEVLGIEEDDKATAYEASACDKCGAIFVISGGHGGEPHKDLDSSGETTCDGYVSAAEGPMMSYHYPVKLDGTAEDAARKIAHLPLCVIEWPNGGYSLALTGGGMDLSWEICEAFMHLGQLPPVHFRPPRMADELTPRRAHVLSAYLKSCSVQAKRARYAAKDARATRKWYAERAKKEKKRA